MCQVQRMNGVIGADLNREIDVMNKEYVANLIGNSILTFSDEVQMK